MFDALEYRGASQVGLEQLAQPRRRSVYNGLTDEYHPTQMLADVMTMREHSDKPIPHIKYAYLGDYALKHGALAHDCRRPDGHGCANLWAKETVASAEYEKIARDLKRNPARKLTITDDPKAAVEGVDFVHTDVWFPWAKRRRSGRSESDC